MGSNLIAMTEIEIDDIKGDSSRFQEDVGNGVDTGMVNLCTMRHNGRLDVAFNALWKDEGCIFIRSGFHPSSSKRLYLINQV